jgi:hypothetical protein
MLTNYQITLKNQAIADKHIIPVVNMASHTDNNTYQTYHNLTTDDEDASIFGYANGGPLKQCDFQTRT